MLASLLKIAALWTTRRYDLEIYAMDSAIWDGLVAFLGRLLVTHTWMLHLAETVYYALPGVIVLVFAFHTYRRHDLEINFFGPVPHSGDFGILTLLRRTSLRSDLRVWKLVPFRASSCPSGGAGQWCL